MEPVRAFIVEQIIGLTSLSVDDDICLLYTSFAKDTSRKVKAAFKAKFATGQRIGAYAPIGYRLSLIHI